MILQNKMIRKVDKLKKIKRGERKRIIIKGRSINASNSKIRIQKASGASCPLTGRIFAPVFRSCLCLLGVCLVSSEASGSVCTCERTYASKSDLTSWSSDGPHGAGSGAEAEGLPAQEEGEDDISGTEFVCETLIRSMTLEEAPDHAHLSGSRLPGKGQSAGVADLKLPL